MMEVSDSRAAAGVLREAVPRAAMCISTGEAAFSGTIVYCGRQHHPVHGLIHVMGYQNTAVNLTDGPNAMLLHLPTR